MNGKLGNVSHFVGKHITKSNFSVKLPASQPTSEFALHPPKSGMYCVSEYATGQPSLSFFF